MSTIPDIIWVLIGLLLFSFLLIVGFNTTLGDFLKTKLARTILCAAVIILGVVAFASGINQISIAKSTMLTINWGKLAPFIILAAIGGISASLATLIWFYKVKDMKPTKPKKR